jgi:hypothetical protein
LAGSPQWPDDLAGEGGRHGLGADIASRARHKKFKFEYELDHVSSDRNRLPSGALWSLVSPQGVIETAMVSIGNKSRGEGQMATRSLLTTCRVCGHEVSQTAVTCPHCGHRLRRPHVGGESFHIKECNFQATFYPMMKGAANRYPEDMTFTLVRIGQFDNFIFNAVNEVLSCSNSQAQFDLTLSRQMLDHGWMEFNGHPEERDWDPNNLSGPQKRESRR